MLHVNLQYSRSLARDSRHMHIIIYFFMQRFAFCWALPHFPENIIFIVMCSCFFCGVQHIELLVFHEKLFVLNPQTGGTEEVYKEQKRQQELENNYRFVWGENQEESQSSSTSDSDDVDIWAHAVLLGLLFWWWTPVETDKKRES